MALSVGNRLPSSCSQGHSVFNIPRCLLFSPVLVTEAVGSLTHGRIWRTLDTNMLESETREGLLDITVHSQQAQTSHGVITKIVYISDGVVFFLEHLLYSRNDFKYWDSVNPQFYSLLRTLDFNGDNRVTRWKTKLYRVLQDSKCEQVPLVRERSYNFKHGGQRRLHRDSEFGVLSLITGVVINELRMWNKNSRGQDSCKDLDGECSWLIWTAIWGGDSM